MSLMSSVVFMKCACILCAHINKSAPVRGHCMLGGHILPPDLGNHTTSTLGDSIYGCLHIFNLEWQPLHLYNI